MELAKKSLQTLQNNGFGTWFSDLCTPSVSKAEYIYITTKYIGTSYLRVTRKNGLVFKRSGRLYRRRASLERAFENRQDIVICSLRDHLPAFRLPCVDGRPYRFSSRHHGGKPDEASKRGQVIAFESIHVYCRLFGKCSAEMKHWEWIDCFIATDLQLPEVMQEIRKQWQTRNFKLKHLSLQVRIVARAKKKRLKMKVVLWCFDWFPLWRVRRYMRVRSLCV